MKPDNVNLGKYDLNKLLRNPALIHRIQDNLLALKDDSLFADALRKGAKDTPDSCVKTIISQFRDNPPMITRIVGKETLKLIEEFSGTSFTDDLNDVL